MDNENLEICQVCGQPISTRADTCPHCGDPKQRHFPLLGCLNGIGLTVVGLTLVLTLLGRGCSSS